MFPGYASDCEIPDDSESLFWVKIAFPEIFTKESLENLEVYLNTFPFVNRQIVYKQHNFRSTGRIIPLKCPSRTQFLNIRSFQDNKGREYVKTGNGTSMKKIRQVYSACILATLNDLIRQCPLINFKSITINERRRECFRFNESGCTFDAAQRVVQQDK